VKAVSSSVLDRDAFAGWEYMEIKLEAPNLYNLLKEILATHSV
jgi:hypothetical protein